jgi:BMFP domain-containing protein YqiC
MKETLLEDLSTRIAALAAGNPASDLQRNVRAVLSSAFERHGLVSRTEFDVQREVLSRSREKLAQLEARVRELEAALPKNN